MKLPHIVQKVYWEPWLITATSHAAIRSIVESKLQGNHMAFDVEEMEAEPMYEVVGPVAVVGVKGVILKGASKIEKMCGACSTEDVAANLELAYSDPSVKGVFLNVDSPGGTVAGVPELGDMVAELNQSKPVMAYADGLMASAAYWLAAGASEIVSSASAEVGSIGVYMPWVDQTAAYEKAGYKVEIIKNDGADLKGAGYPGTKLTDSQRADMQEQVNQIGKMFRNHVEKHRGKLSDNSFRGQTFMGAEAINAGLVDSLTPMGRAMQDHIRLVS